MMRYDRYDKNVIEPYALSTIAYSYDLSYKNYFRPKNTDNFDYISQDGKRALEISLVISENEREAYIYDKELNNKKDPDPLRIKDVRIEENGNIVSYRGGSMHEIYDIAMNRIEEKNRKAQKRMEAIEHVDLCLCVQDGSLFDRWSFEIFFNSDLDRYIFDKIFFILPEGFIRYKKGEGFKEYEKKICGN